MIQLQKFTFNAFQENTYVLWDVGKNAIIIDPGCYEKREQQELVDFIEQQNLKVEKVVNTHCHIDHVLGAQFCCNHFKVPFHIPQGEDAVLRAVPTYAPMYGFPMFQMQEPDELIPIDQTKLTFGNVSLDILYVPGHSPGHVVFYSAEEQWVVNGDVLFYGSIGRTDLPGGNHEQLIENIQSKMFSLPENTVVYCGHGPETSIGFEKKNNPFCALG